MRHAPVLLHPSQAGQRHRLFYAERPGRRSALCRAEHHPLAAGDGDIRRQRALAASDDAVVEHDALSDRHHRHGGESQPGAGPRPDRRRWIHDRRDLHQEHVGQQPTVGAPSRLCPGRAGIRRHRQSPNAAGVDCLLRVDPGRHPDHHVPGAARQLAAGRQFAVGDRAIPGADAADDGDPQRLG